MEEGESVQHPTSSGAGKTQTAPGDSIPKDRDGKLPIHQLMVDNGVTIFFHGHDHIYAMEELDGIVYLECPKPDDAGYAWDPYGYGYTEGLYPNGYLTAELGPYPRDRFAGRGNR